MILLLILTIFIPPIYSLSLGKEVLILKHNESVTEVKSIFKGSALKFSAECSTKDDITVIYSIKPHHCQPNNITLISEELRRDFSKDGKVIELTCHDFVEEATLSNSTFPHTGIYLFRMVFSSSVNKVSTKVTVEVWHEDYGYLSPMEWPFLPFYSVMCGVYTVYALVWLVLCCCYWREILRVQFWIGAVIFMGMLEKAMFTGEYDSMRKNGTTTGGLMIAAEVISSIKKTTSRMLIIIVSLGFGFIKPRLGTAMHHVTLVGMIFFVLSLFDGIARTQTSDSRMELTMATIIYLALAMTDSFIILWILTSLIKTIRTLTVRKNAVKLALYWHFRNVLFFFVFVSVVYSLWSSYQFRWTSCKVDWQDFWWDTSFWHIQFSVILFAIIILWRPSVNNQRYAYSPLHDVDDDEYEKTEWTNEASGVTKTKKGGSEKKKPEDDDMKWVEENIPSSRLDKVLNNIIDSEDDHNDKVEASKML